VFISPQKGSMVNEVTMFVPNPTPTTANGHARSYPY
jgi:hypothetical protein